MNPFHQKSLKIVAAILVIFALLVATHKGEFWPFSIFPMFSQAGQPWTRALMQDVSQVPNNQIWKTTDLNHLHGPTVVLSNIGVNQIDFSDFISKTRIWDEAHRKALLQKLQHISLDDKQWLITKVQGHFAANDSIVVQAIPFLLINGDTVFTNPTLPARLYNAKL